MIHLDGSMSKTADIMPDRNNTNRPKNNSFRRFLRSQALSVVCPTDIRKRMARHPNQRTHPDRLLPSQNPTTITFTKAPTSTKIAKPAAMFTPYTLRRTSAEERTLPHPTALAARAPATVIERKVTRKKGA